MDANVILSRTCPFCGHKTDVTCTYEQYREYTLNPGALVQDVFADKDITTRETIISGMCEDCQDKFFTEEEPTCDGKCDTCYDCLCPECRAYDDEDSCDGECDVCFDSDCPSSQAYEDSDCNGVCELCEINDDCPNSTAE